MLSMSLPLEIGATTISFVFTWNQILSAISPLLGGLLADAFGIQFALYLISLLSLTAALLDGILEPKQNQNYVFLRELNGKRCQILIRDSLLTRVLSYTVCSFKLA